MAKNKIIPTKAEDFISWGENFLQRLPQQPAMLTAPKDRELSDLLSQLITEQKAVDAAKRALASALETRDHQKSQRLSRLSELIADLKKSDNYNNAIGAELDLLTSPEVETDWSAAQPKANVSIVGGKVQIAFVKGKSEGVAVYCRRGGQQDFEEVRVVTSSPFIDRRANLNNAPAERREYYLMYIKGNDPTGIASDIVVTNC